MPILLARTSHHESSHFPNRIPQFHSFFFFASQVWSYRQWEAGEDPGGLPGLWVVAQWAAAEAGGHAQVPEADFDLHGDGEEETSEDVEVTRPGELTQKAMENGPVEIADFPMKHGDFA